MDSLPPSPESRADRRRFLRSLTGSVVFLAVGSEAALGRSLLLRAAQQDPVPRSQPTTLTSSGSASSTLTIPMPSGFVDPSVRTELWTGPLRPATWTKTFVRYTRSISFTLSQEPPPVSYTEYSFVSVTPGQSVTESYSINSGTVTIYYTPSNDSCTMTASVTQSETASWTTTTPLQQGGYEPLAVGVDRDSAKSAPIRKMDLDIPIDQVLSRFTHLSFGI
jgi:hypothetical protein